MFKCQYCRKECKNKRSLISHELLCKDNPNRRESSFVKYNANLEHAWNKGLTENTDPRVKANAESIRNSYKLGITKPYNLGTHHTEETKKKISNSLKKYLEENPDMIPYKRNHHSKQSYPEKYFEQVFSNDNLLKDFVEEYQVGLYSLDFAYPNIKIYIEIDGDQHYLDKKLVKHDIIRTNKLEELGWKGIRIKWSDYKKLDISEQNNFIQNIKEQFLSLR